MIGHVLTAFAAVFLAELPDKTMVATLVLSARFRRPLPVWLGVIAAFAVHVTAAVLLGSLLRRLPERPVDVAVGLVFLVGAVLLWRDQGEAVGEASGTGEQPIVSPWRIALASGSVVLLAEIGDLTQLATAGLASRTGDPVAVWLGAWLALASVAGLAVTAGRAIERRVPLALVRKVAAGVFLVLALVSFVSAAT
ncbi:MAG: TMEM165/GDT1 family protein [Actinomycetota bacterium]|nr:MAG: TMEM165/GDT1 family protein [Actinomycetota bacterium]